MGIKHNQARGSLALLIEEQLGYAMLKVPPSPSQNEFASEEKTPAEYVVASPHGHLKRALKRAQLVKIQKQKNLEAVMGLALGLCPNVTSRGRPDPDWMSHFISLAEDIANPVMQKLWAKILVGESIMPGTFSVKSLQTLTLMTQKEASALQKCAPLCGHQEKDDSYLILVGYHKKPSLLDLLRKVRLESINLSKAGLSFPNILTLMDINLLYRQEIESGNLQKGQSFHLKYLNKQLTITAKSNDLVLSYYKLTQTGEELKKLLQSPIQSHYKNQLEQVLGDEFDIDWH